MVAAIDEAVTKNMSFEEKRTSWQLIYILSKTEISVFHDQGPGKKEYCATRSRNRSQQISEAPCDPVTLSEGTSAVTSTVFSAECTSTWRRFPYERETAKRERNPEFFTSQL